MGVIFVWVGTIVCIVAGVLFVVGIFEVRGERTRAWRVVAGRVLESTIITLQRMDHEGNHSTITEPQVTFEYELDGRIFTSSRVWSHVQLSGPGPARTIVLRYPAGAPVSVHVPLDAPDQGALIQQGPQTKLLFVVLFSLFTFLIGALFVVLGR